MRNMFNCKRKHQYNKNKEQQQRQNINYHDIIKKANFITLRNFTAKCFSTKTDALLFVLQEVLVSISLFASKILRCYYVVKPSWKDCSLYLDF